MASGHKSVRSQVAYRGQQSRQQDVPGVSVRRWITTRGRANHARLGITGTSDRRCREDERRGHIRTDGAGKAVGQYRDLKMGHIRWATRAVRRSNARQEAWRQCAGDEEHARIQHMISISARRAKIATVNRFWRPPAAETKRKPSAARGAERPHRRP